MPNEKVKKWQNELIRSELIRMHTGMLAVQEKELLRLLLKNTSLCLFTADSGERSCYYCKSRGQVDVLGAVQREFKLEHQSMQQICTSVRAASQA